MIDKTVTPYTILARIYDDLMDDVDYEIWADFIDAIIQQHHPGAVSILELACGTGSMAISLDELECYHILATDQSEEMLDIGRRKKQQHNADVRFERMDFQDIHTTETFDIVVCVFDSVNYILNEEALVHFLNGIQQVLGPNGLFIFDFTTPRNSIQAISMLNNEEGYSGQYRYFRKSSYEPRKQLHYNNFSIERLAADHEQVIETFNEEHVQRIYSLAEMQSIIDRSEMEIVAQYGEFELVEADQKSLRVTMVTK